MPAPKGHPPYNKNGEGGRPVVWTEELINAEAEAFEEWMTRKDSLWYEDFARERGYLAKTYLEFAKKNERFGKVYQKAQDWQKSLLIRGGLINKFNVGMAKLVLFNACGWSDKTENKISGDSANPLSFIIDNATGKSKDIVDENNS